jgi:RNA polymerase sigma-70 factor (TIGR02943 family)
MHPNLHPEKWVDLYADYLFNRALFKLSNIEQAEDIVQETFLAAYKAKETFKGEASEKTWLTSILHNKIIDAYRKNAREAKVFQQQKSNTDFFEEDNGHWLENAMPKDLSLDSLAKLQQKELYASIINCLDKLPPQWKLISCMKLIEEENTETICKAFDINPSNFWVIMHRAKLQLRSCIEKKWTHP